jgi:hypothetical protein
MKVTQRDWQFKINGVGSHFMDSAESRSPLNYRIFGGLNQEQHFDNLACNVY